MYRFEGSIKGLRVASTGVRAWHFVHPSTGLGNRHYAVATSKEITSPEWSQILPAAAVFHAAQKSKFLSFNRHKAGQILTDLWVCGVNRNKILDPKDSQFICQKNAIQPSDLTMLAQVLLRSPPPPNAPRTPSLGSLGLHLLSSAASLNDTLAIIRLASNVLKVSSSTPNMSLEGEAHMRNLRRLSNDGVVEATILLAQVYTQRGQIEAAIPFWERASEAGSGYACSELGKIYLQRPDHEHKAKSAFQKGVELYDVDSHHQLALILMKETGFSAQSKELFSLAAASGSELAAKQLSSMFTRSDGFIAEEWVAFTK